MKNRKHLNLIAAIIALLALTVSTVVFAQEPPLCDPTWWWPPSWAEFLNWGHECEDPFW